MSVNRKKISELNAASALAGTEALAVVQDAATKKATVNQITAHVIAQLGDNVRVKVSDGHAFLQLRDKSTTAPGFRTVWLVDGGLVSGALDET